MNHSFVIHQTEDGFVTEVDGVLHRVLAITLEGQEVEGFLPTLTEDGQFAWAFGHVFYDAQIMPGAASYTADVTLENTETGERLTREMRLDRVLNASDRGQQMFELREVQGVTVLRNRHLAGGPMGAFANTGTALRDEPVLILDLRGHGGGTAIYALDWVWQYTGQMPGQALFYSVRPSTETLGELIPPLEQILTSDQLELVQDWGAFLEDPEQGMIQNENLLIVLIDNAVASTGDMFVGYLRQLENVLIVGANTGGVLVTGDVTVVPLPYSRIPVMFGTGLNVRPDLSQFEGVGFAPDL